MLNNYDEYAVFLSTLFERFIAIQEVEFNTYLTSATEGYAEGTITFSDAVTLTFIEHIDFAAKRLFKYGYTVYQAGAKIYYYDPQPHPNDPTLAATFPHHKHLPPDLKHHRIPAPAMTFEYSNLEFVIREIETTLLTL
ncbi:MAG: DUF6516 family protein [candidate division KSB1 bacterium]